MAQGQGIKPKAGQYGYNTGPAPAPKSGGVSQSRRNFKGGTPSQIIETQKTHQGMTKKSGK